MKEEDEVEDAKKIAVAEKIAAAKASRIADLEEKIAERQDPRSHLSNWFCPAKGDFGCTGPRCPRFYIFDVPNPVFGHELRCDFGRGSRNP